MLAELYEKMIAANRTENSVKRMLSLKRILHDLPTHHFDTFHYLAEHLHRVQLHSDKNKMDVHNIAIVFGPTLIRPKGESIASLVQHMADQCRIVESIVSFVRHSRLCKASLWFVNVLLLLDCSPHGSSARGRKTRTCRSTRPCATHFPSAASTASSSTACRRCVSEALTCHKHVHVHACS